MHAPEPAYTQARALDGLKVADFSWAAAAPIATRILADHGAEVVRVESSVHPDTVRITGPFRDDRPGINRSGFYADFNSSKYSLALNMKTEGAADIARRLIGWADVVVESFTPRVMEQWGLAYDHIRVWKPEIIMVSSCMQGQTGPYRNYPGYGGQGAAIAGMHFLTGWPDLDPAGPKGAYTDTIAPRLTVAAILAAFDYRDRTGVGQHIDLSQIEACVGTFLTTEMLDYSCNGRVAQRLANRHPFFAPHGCYPAAGRDRWITIAIETDPQWIALRDLTGDPALRDASFDSVAGRRPAQDAIDASISHWTRDQDAWALVERLQAAGIPAGVVQSAKDLLEDPQLAFRGHFAPLEHPEMGVVGYNGLAHILSETSCVPRWAAPCLGEHTQLVLRDILRYSSEEIAAFAARDLLT